MTDHHPAAARHTRRRRLGTAGLPGAAGLLPTTAAAAGAPATGAPGTPTA
ncbi:hypothetical protein ACH41E_24190 [Streptomyces sp. NPDC020412]